MDARCTGECEEVGGVGLEDVGAQAAVFIDTLKRSVQGTEGVVAVGVSG